jgi:hypothetical protein
MIDPTRRSTGAYSAYQAAAGAFSLDRHTGEVVVLVRRYPVTSAWIELNVGVLFAALEKPGPPRAYRLVLHGVTCEAAGDRTGGRDAGASVEGAKPHERNGEGHYDD